MTTSTRPLLLLVAVAALAAGCGGSNGSVAATSTAHTKTTSTRTSEATLKAAVQAAIRANVHLSTYVLWHNQIPTWATQSTRGPALKALRAAAAARRRQGIQIKNLSGHYTITSIALAPSYTAATAVIKSHQRVAPYKAGRRLGRAIVGDDHAQIHLRRIGNAQRFIVWSVSPIR
jgi:hypothetical protein